MLALRLLLHVLLPTTRAAAACPLQWLPVLLAGAPPEKSMQMIGRHVHDASAARPLHDKVAVLNAHLEGNLGDEV